MNSKAVMSIVKAWLPLAVTIVLLSGLIDLAVQQDLRQSANDPQIQLAEDTAQQLSSGHYSPSVLAAITVDPSQSLAPFMIVYDQAGHVVASGAKLNGQTPMPPAGVFSFAKAHGEDRFTWQTASGLRLATVVKSYSAGDQTGYVLAARSLREVEQREDNILMAVVLGGLVTLAASLATAFVFGFPRD